MISVIVISHLDYAISAVNTAYMIVGKHENIYPISVTYEKGLEDVVNEIETIINGTENEVLILTDIIGGTPFNAVLRILKKYKNIYAYTGFNLPMLISIFPDLDLDIDEVTKNLNEIYLSSFIDINEKLKKCE